jgi:hypothetical protein
MRLLLILLPALLVGCSSNPLTNRISVTLDGKDAYVNSMYGPIGVTSKIDPKDAEVLREITKLKAMLDAVSK